MVWKVDIFSRTQPEENYELCGTDNVWGQISEHIFAPDGGYILCLSWFFKYFFATRTYLDITHAISCRDISSHMTRFDRSPESKQLEPQNFSWKWKCGMKKDNKAGVRSPGRLKLSRLKCIFLIIAGGSLHYLLCYLTPLLIIKMFSFRRDEAKEKKRRNVWTKTSPGPPGWGLCLEIITPPT